MKLVTFAVSTPVGRMTRLGALVDGQEQGRIADLTTAFAAYLASETDEGRPREIAAVRTPPDMIGWLEGGRQSREAAEQALGYVRRRLAADAPTGGAGRRAAGVRAGGRATAGAAAAAALDPRLLGVRGAHVAGPRHRGEAAEMVPLPAVLQGQSRRR